MYVKESTVFPSYYPVIIGVPVRLCKLSIINQPSADLSKSWTKELLRDVPGRATDHGPRPTVHRDLPDGNGRSREAEGTKREQRQKGHKHTYLVVAGITAAVRSIN